MGKLDAKVLGGKEGEVLMAGPLLCNLIVLAADPY